MKLLVLIMIASPWNPNTATQESYVNGSGVAAGAISNSNSATSCGTGDTACSDKNGVIGGVASGTTDPRGVMLRGKQCSPTDTSCTAGNVSIAGGSGIVDIQIDGADPSVSCAGDNDTVTYTVLDANGTAVISAVTLTEGTQWTATASVADTCASLAAAFEVACTVSSIDYCNASCTSPEVQVYLTPAASALTTLTESTAGCTTVATLTFGEVLFNGKVRPTFMGAAAANSPRYCFDTDCTSYMLATADNTVAIYTGGNPMFTFGAASIQLGTLMLANGQTIYASSGVTYLGSTTSYDVAATGAATGSIVLRGGMMLPRVNAAATTGIVVACGANNVNGSIAYFEDTNDTAAGQLCVCHNTGDAAWAWVQIQDMTTACTLD